MAKGYTVRGFAHKLGISRSLYYKIEEGARDPRLPLMGAIARELGQPVDALFFGQGVDEMSAREVSAS